MTRIDAFIIWPHGVRHLAEIMSILRRCFDIIMIYRKDVSDMSSFVDDVYGCDTYPLKHIKSKIRYLKKLEKPWTCFFVLVRNYNVDERLAGSGKFRKPQCMYLQGIKSSIRSEFNPSKNDHVIHGTDYEDQVPYLLNVFGLKKLSYYTRDVGISNYPYHLPKPKHYRNELADMDMLRVNIIGEGWIKVEDSPHFAYICGHKDYYIDYFYKHIGRKLKEDHFPEKFDSMIKNFGVLYNDRLIVNGHKVLDGVHRLAIYKFLGKGFVDVINVKI